MASIVLITGGCRSGKSAYGLRLGEETASRRAVVATCPVLDGEMAARIERHQQDRVGRGWEIIEETADLAGVLRANHEYDLLLVDCLTLWINNLMYGKTPPPGEREIALRTAEVVEACRKRKGTVIFVTNEVGLGVVPENVAARRYRDLVGRCGQIIASAAGRVVLTVCGIPWRIK